MPSIVKGMQLAKVLKLEPDPSGENRIFINIPSLNRNKGSGVWAKIARLDAGNNRGTIFLPEIGDDVITGFIDNDSNKPVVLGMLNSSAKPSPLKASDTNHEKGFTTRSNMHVHFNDQTKTITIDTPAGNSIKLDEEGSKIEISDQNMNKIILDPSGIKMESPGRIEIKAGTSLILNAGTSISIDAPSVSVKADANLDMEGVSAKLKTSGPMEISGLPVKIN